MSFFEIMLNFLVGICGGIFSSIIVSRIFFILSDYSEQIKRVQARVESSYGLSGMLMAAEMLITEGYSADKFIKEKIDIFLEEERKQYLSMIFDDLEPELHIIAIDFNDFIDGLDTSGEFSGEIRKNINTLDDLISKFNKYKQSSKKKMYKLFIKDTALRLLFVILLLIVAVTIIA